MGILLLIIGVLLFVGLVVFHEFGHFIAARRNGVEVEEFGIGFPPRAKVLARRRGTLYSLNWLPLGGFVRLKGENDSDTGPGSYGAASLRTKVKIMLAGVAMNLVAAFLLLTLGAAIGMPKIIKNQYTVASDTTVVRQEVYAGHIVKDSPAEQAGLRLRDRLLSIAAIDSPDEQVITIDETSDVTEATERWAGRSVVLRVGRDGQELDLTATLRDQQADDRKGYLGVGPTEYILRRSTWSAPIVAAGLMKQFTIETFKGIGTALSSLQKGDTKKASEQVSGPVGVFVLIKDGSFLGPEFIIFIIAVISLTLAIMNALPIPALDGGRLFVTLTFRALRKPLSKDTEDKIHGLGFLALMVLFITITVVDIKRFF